MVTYEVRVNGAMPAEVIERLGHIQAVQSAGTTLEVDVPDEAALWGVIDTLRGAGLDLLEVRRHHPQPPAEPPPE